MGEAVTGSGSPLDLGECRHGIAQHRRVDGSSGRLLCLAVALVLSVTMAGAARATEKEKRWHDWFWPPIRPISS